MNQYFKYALTAAVTAAAIVAYQYEGKPEQAGLAQQAPSPVPIQVPEIKNEIAQVEQSLAGVEEPSAKRELTQAELADIDPASIDWEAVKDRIFPGVDQMLLRFNMEAEYSDREVAAFNKLHVIEFNPTIDSVCHEEESEHAVGGFVTICEGIKKYPDHPYASLEIEKILELVETDAAAAVFASRKAEKIEDRLGYALRAAALSGKSGPILAAAASNLGTPVDIFGGEKHGESAYRTVPETVVTRIILETVAHKMGDPRAKPNIWAESVTEFAGNQAIELEVREAIDVAVGQALEGMAKIQQEVTGSTQVRELLDA